MKIGIILGSIRDGRIGAGVAEWVKTRADGRGDADYELLDLKKFNIPLLESGTHPGALKNAVDVLGPEWVGKAIGFVGYGSAGGVRAVEQWRQIAGNLSMVDVRQQLDLSLFTEFNEAGFAPNARREGELGTLLDQLTDMARRLA